MTLEARAWQGKDRQSRFDWSMAEVETDAAPGSGAARGRCCVFEMLLTCYVEQVAVGVAVLPLGRLTWKPNSPMAPGARVPFQLTPR